MRSTNWIKDLINVEKEMEEKGVIDVNAGFNPDANLEKETIQFLTDIKELFIDFANASLSRVMKKYLLSGKA